MTLAENLNDSTWLENFDYKVSYNKNYILVIDLMIEGSGAYPDGSTKTFVIDLKTGQRVYLNQVFSNIPGLLLKIDRQQKAEVRREVASLRKDGEKEAASELREMVKRSGYSPSKFEEFSVSDAGVVFKYDYGFPHAVKALEPAGRYTFSWRALRGHIRRDGLLAKFIN